MITGTGKNVYSGIAIGKVFVYQKAQLAAQTAPIADATTEVTRFFEAKEAARRQLAALYEKTVLEVGQDEAMIIDVQLMMMDDPDFNDTVVAKIKEENMAALTAVQQTGEEFANIFAAMDNEYMNARATDVRDVSHRLAAILSGNVQQGLYMDEPMIIVADDLTPSETVQFEKNKILAFVTKKGSFNSHTAILARIMNIPSLVQADIDVTDSLQGRMMIVDGISGTYYLDPDEETLYQMRKKQKEAEGRRALLQQMRGLETVTPSGRKINLYANIGKPEDVEIVLSNDAEGIGLYRSEFMFVGKKVLPTEEEQFACYKKVVTAMEGKRVIIRTIDIGADKQAPCFNLETEENPALGYRGIRICLLQNDIFKTHLRAILRASAFGKVGIMFPMIISVQEVLESKAVLDACKQELTAEGVAFGEVEVGIMIETPAAVMIADSLAKEVDFFSVGTNDLTQYTLAIDRQNTTLDRFYDSHHPAVLQMLKMVADSAHANGIWAGICGELAADETLIDTFLEMGYDELSVSPVFTLPLRKKIRESTVR